MPLKSNQIHPAFRIAAILAGTFLILLIVPQIGSRDSGRTGEQLAKTHCGGCHRFPEPGLLSAETWTKDILPEMGLRLGIGDRNTVLERLSFKTFEKVCRIGIYPDKPALTLREWNRIRSYYENNAPRKDPVQPVKDAIKEFAHPFRITTLPAEADAKPSTTMVRFDARGKGWWQASGNNEVSHFDADMQAHASLQSPGPVVDMIFSDQTEFLSIGTIASNEDRNGRLFKPAPKGSPKRWESSPDSLHRPVQAIRHDIDEDGFADLLIAEFGFETGYLRLFDGRTGTCDTLSTQPGARQLFVKDIDGDGHREIIALFAQGREEVVRFDRTDRGYRRKTLVDFPSVYGTSSLDMADMDGDGREDLIFTQGDNADYSLVRKAFHGLRIYRNMGNDVFREAYFYPVYGATKAMAGDFDADGDMDMALIAFFSPEDQAESFLYFKNTGNGRFDVSNLGLPYAKWLVMDVGDLEGDGDLDILLGNFLMRPEDEKSAGRAIKCMLLRNTLSNGGL